MISNSKQKFIEEPFYFESPKNKPRNLEDNCSMSPINLYHSNRNMHSNNLAFNSDDEKPCKIQINNIDNQANISRKNLKKLNTIKIVAEVQNEDEAEIIINPDLIKLGEKKEGLGNIIGMESPIKLKYKIDSIKKSRNRYGKIKNNDSSGINNNSSIFGYLSSRAYDDESELVKSKDGYEDFFN